MDRWSEGSGDPDGHDEYYAGEPSEEDARSTDKDHYAPAGMIRITHMHKTMKKGAKAPTNRVSLKVGQMVLMSPEELIQVAWLGSCTSADMGLGDHLKLSSASTI